MRKQWYYRLLLSYLPIFIVVSSVVVLISIISVRLTIGNEANRVNEVATKQMLQSVDDALRSIDQLIVKEILNSVTFDKFFDPAKETNKYLDSLEMSERIRNIIHATPLIDSLYLYRFRDQIVLTRDERISIDQFPDRDFLLEVIQHQPKSKWSDLRKVSEMNVYSNEVVTRKVLTLTSKVPTISGGQGLIVVNVRPYAIQSMIEQMANSQYSHLDFVDRENGSIASIGESEVEAGKKKIHSFEVASDYTGWSMHSSVNNSKVYGFSSAIFYACYVLWLLVIAFGGYWMYAVTRKNYKPIEALTDRLERFKSQKSMQLLGSEKRNDFDFIEAAIDQLIDQVDGQQVLKNENVKYRHTKLFLDLLEGNMIHRDDELIVQMLEERYVARVALAEIDRFPDFAVRYNKRDQYLLKYAILRVFQEVAEKHRIRVWTEWVQADQLAVLFQSGHLSSKVETITQEVCDWIQVNLDITITIGIGSLAEEIDDIAESHKAAVHAVKMKFKFGGNRVISVDNIQHLKEEELVVQPQLLRSIAQTFRQGDSGWSAKLKEFVQQTSEASISKDSVLNLMKLVLFSIDREMSETSSDLKTIWKNGLNSLNEGLEPIETEDELYSYFYAQLDAIFGEINKRKDEDSQTALLYKIKAYLDEHYEDPDLSMSGIGELFQINSSFMSRIFKEEIGMNMMDYLMLTRVERAKQLLRETRDTVQSIAGQVGYLHTISFIRAFKKSTGLTPGEYRKISTEAD
ncbi:helix-turn-helix domain-containing protein [Paenibacillus sp. RC67]|uniref:helix-turn-helix domain-containing protein n=1 Tax=Paenibacillus sp. RC67 TaxID=3039392 RepID=UPI0024AD09A4|nr:helix-turn-helix domain-containing protein [Paenibacillus sp. RC67]